MGSQMGLGCEGIDYDRLVQMRLDYCAMAMEIVVCG
jgi:hypothetical protein